MPNVKIGQIWQLLHPHSRVKTFTTFTVVKVENGYATVQGETQRRIRLDSFERKHYYQLLKEAR